ncbi:hypothetical protein HAX54_040898, partial [Datura stramonium]|nr:hypothetical protein [Datura stramonium]
MVKYPEVSGSQPEGELSCSCILSAARARWEHPNGHMSGSGSSEDEDSPTSELDKLRRLNE